MTSTFHGFSTVGNSRGVYVKVYEKYYKVVAMFTDQGEANDFMETRKDVGMIAEIDGYVFLAAMSDEGIL